MLVESSSHLLHCYGVSFAAYLLLSNKFSYWDNKVVLHCTLSVQGSMNMKYAGTMILGLQQSSEEDRKTGNKAFQKKSLAFRAVFTSLNQIINVTLKSATNRPNLLARYLLDKAWTGDYSILPFCPLPKKNFVMRGIQIWREKKVMS